MCSGCGCGRFAFFLPHCNGGFKLLWVCLCVRSYRVFWNLCLQIALEWLHDVARALFWGGSRSTKPCVFPCKVAAAGDERYLVCAAGAAAVVSCANCSSYDLLCVLQRVVVSVCVVLCGS